jgi:hypothetical protein
MVSAIKIEHTGKKPCKPLKKDGIKCTISYYPKMSGFKVVILD